MGAFVAAAIQMVSGGDRTHNLARAADLVAAAARRGARLVVLPEVFAWRGPQDAEGLHAEPIPGPSTDALAAAARAHGVYICAGSVLEADPGELRPFNTTCLIAPDGVIVARYRKMHLFDVDIPGRVSVRESDHRRPGDAPVAVATPLGTVGLSICYDLRFPELYRRLVHAGATLLLVPSAFTFPTGAAHWEVLCRARAIENQCYLIAANQAGMSPHGFADYGHSMIVDPWGTVLARAGDEEGLVLAEVDPVCLERVRRELPCLEHVRIGRP